MKPPDKSHSNKSTSNIDRFQRVEIASEQELWDWLKRNHGQEESVLLITWKASDRRRYVARDQVLDALIAHGWIDGRRYKLDAKRTMQLVSPRKQQAWAQTYKDRAQRLIDDGRMASAGLAAINKSKRSELWDSMKSVDQLVDPADLVAELAKANATDWWAQSAPSYRRNVLRWITSAKRPPTRAKRIRVVSEHAALGKKVPNY